MFAEWGYIMQEDVLKWFYDYSMKSKIFDDASKNVSANCLHDSPLI